jgi:hypothetical protein
MDKKKQHGTHKKSPEIDPGLYSATKMLFLELVSI